MIKLNLYEVKYTITPACDIHETAENSVFMVADTKQEAIMKIQNSILNGWEKRGYICHYSDENVYVHHQDGNLYEIYADFKANRLCC